VNLRFPLFSPWRASGWPALWSCAAALACLLLAGAAPAQTMVRASTGTGFFITGDGYLLTCFHVVVNSGAIRLRNLKGETFTARAVAVDRANDLALLKVDETAGGVAVTPGRFRPLPLAPSGDVRRGTGVVTMGFPNVNLQGIEPKVTDGIVNSFSGANNDPRVFQISSPIQTGNSGGPLINMEGNVVGVIASKLDAAAIARQTGDIPQNVNYAIKSQYALDFLAKVPDLKAKLPAPARGEKPRIADVVPDLEEAIVLVIATPGPRAADLTLRTPPQPPAPDALPKSEAPPASAERAQRLRQVVAEYRVLRQSLSNLQFNEMSLINQAQMARMLQGAGAQQGSADLQQIQKRLDDLGTRKAEVLKRLNELAAEYRQLQESSS